MGTILVVEDDRDVADFVERGLRGRGHAPTVTDDVQEAKTLALTEEFDLVVLDLHLPTGNGFSVLRAVRDRGGQVPVIVLTGYTEERDAVACLEAGADDYMTKPFRIDELLARVAALLRRVGTAEERVLEAGDLKLDLLSRRAIVGDRTIDLTSREFSLLETFLRRPNQVLTRAQLLSQVWGYFFDPGTNVVYVYISLLRKKLGADVIETVHGIGYRLQATSVSPASTSD